LEHEQDVVDWATLYPQLERMEMRGQLRRGYFVAGLPGVQFALPEAVEALRAANAPAAEGLIVLNAVDPANLFGPERPQTPLRFARLASTWVVIQGGRPILVAQDNGERILSDPEVEMDSLARALAAYLARPYAPRHVTITQWNGAGLLGNAFEPLLRSLDFRRAPAGMER
jgi:ATP-dependent helicase Lhr and Lhr-like helicase